MLLISTFKYHKINMFHHNKLTSAMPHTQQHKNETIKLLYSTTCVSLAFRYNVVLGIFLKYHPYELWAIIYLREKKYIGIYIIMWFRTDVKKSKYMHLFHAIFCWFCAKLSCLVAKSGLTLTIS